MALNISYGKCKFVFVLLKLKQSTSIIRELDSLPQANAHSLTELKI